MQTIVVNRERLEDTEALLDLFEESLGTSTARLNITSLRVFLLTLIGSDEQVIVKLK